MDAVFILDALDPVSTDTLTHAAAALAERITTDAPGAVVTTRLLDGR